MKSAYRASPACGVCSASSTRGCEGVFFFLEKREERGGGGGATGGQSEVRNRCLDTLTPRFVWSFSVNLMRKRGVYRPFLNGATSVFRFLVWNDTLW